jgi:hypothetical protein
MNIPARVASNKADEVVRNARDESLPSDGLDRD